MFKFIKLNRASLVVCAVFFVYTLGSFAVYCARTLDGNINNHILAAEVFGVPKALSERGITPMYYGPTQSGWDGQFYYYISNDLLGRTDASDHIDSPSYRYQRVGLPLFTAAVASILGRDWVSPFVFFWSYFSLLLVATFVGARLFSKVGLHPATILLWALGIGTQITLFNALPDAAADAFLVIALAALVSGRYALSVVPFAFAALSREVYVLFPSFLILFYLVDSISGERANGRKWIYVIAGMFAKWRPYYLLSFPVGVAAAWWLYVVLHFRIPPGEQAHGILGKPLASWFEYFWSGVSGSHKLVGGGLFGYFESAALLLFLGVLILSLWISARVLLNRDRAIPVFAKGIAFATAALALLYTCFGPTVIMHYTGYFKAVGVFFLLTPFLIRFIDIPKTGRITVIALMFTALVFTTYYNMRARILPFNGGMDRYTKISTVSKEDRIECFGRYDARIRVQNVAFHTKSSFLKIFGASDYLLIDLALENSGSSPFISTKGFGGTYMSYHWVDKNGAVVADGIRTAIPDVLAPGDSKSMTVAVELPKRYGQLQLRLSPVQEGCAWFYISNPDVGSDIHFALAR